MSFCCASVKITPIERNWRRPCDGDCKARPTAKDADSRSVPSADATSRMSLRARLKTSPLTRENLRREVCALVMDSSEKRVERCAASAKSTMSCFERLADSAEFRNAMSSCASASCASLVSSISFFNENATPSPAAAFLNAPTSPFTAFSEVFRGPVSSSISFTTSSMTLFARPHLSLLHEFVAYQLQHFHRNGGLFDQTSTIWPLGTHPAKPRGLMDMRPEPKPPTHRKTTFHRVFIEDSHPGR